MTDRPILFSAPMVRALLDGRKTQTRRLATNKAAARIEVGDRLWVRETWGIGHRPCTFRGVRDGVEYRADEASLKHYQLLPLYDELQLPDGAFFDDYDSDGWRSPIHMPRWASRITLIVAGVAIQPLQDITSMDARREGARKNRVSGGNRMIDRWNMGDAPTAASPRGAFFGLWDKINPAHTASSNPLVRVIVFDVVKGNIDQIEGGPHGRE